MNRMLDVLIRSSTNPEYGVVSMYCSSFERLVLAWVAGVIDVVPNIEPQTRQSTTRGPLW